MSRPVVAAFYTPLGRPISITKRVANVSRSWVRNDIGKGSLALPRTLPDLMTIVSWGNIVRIVEQDLDPWVGVINQQRSWSSGSVEIQLDSLESLLTGHITDQGLRLGAAAGGMPSREIARTIITNALGNGWSPLSVGSLAGTKVHYKEYDYAVLFEALKDLATEDDAWFWVNENRQIYFQPTRGISIEDTFLAENAQLYNVRSTEDASEVVTNILGLGDGSDLVEKPKLLRRIRNPYFFKAEVIDYPDILDQAGMISPVTEELKKRGKPKVTIDAEIPNINNVWQKIRMGNRINIGTYRDQYIVERTRIVGIEAVTGSPLRCLFETIQNEQYGPVEPWVIS